MSVIETSVNKSTQTKSDQVKSAKKRRALYMTLTDIFNKNSILKRYYVKTLIVIGIIWTCIDFTRFLTLSITEETKEYPFAESEQSMFILRLILGLIAYCTMAYMLIFPLKDKLRKYPLWLNFVLKTLILCFLTAIFAVVTFYIVYIFVYGN